jgi:hypothetical protein
MSPGINALYLLGALTAGGLLAYLLVALLKAEEL